VLFLAYGRRPWLAAHISFLGKIEGIVYQNPRVSAMGKAATQNRRAHLRFSPRDWKQLAKTTFSFYGGQLPADLEAGRGCARIS
jgi:hypothetical protein